MVNEQELRSGAFLAENPEIVGRYYKLIEVGRQIFGQSDRLRQGEIGEEEVALAYKFLQQASREFVPPVRASWWEHSLMAGKAGRLIGEELSRLRPDLGINPHELEFYLLLHDTGRLVTPAAFNRNDAIHGRMLLEMGIPPSIAKNSFSLTSITKAHIKGINPEEYWNSMPIIHQLEWMIDNLSKKDRHGQIFTYQRYLDYLAEYSARVEADKIARQKKEASKDTEAKRRDWPSSELYPASQAVSREVDIGPYLVKKTYTWLVDQGVDIEGIWSELDALGPKFVIIARHGNLDIGSDSLVYTRDRNMEPTDIVHLSEKGVNEMKKLGKVITGKEFRPELIFTSPSIGAQESASALGFTDTSTDIREELDDINSAGAYREGIKMSDWPAFEGDKARLEELQRRYPSENYQSVAVRMRREFEKAVRSIKPGKTAIIVSHGDPCACLALYLDRPDTPVTSHPSELKEFPLYLPKGGALVAVIYPNDKLFTLFPLEEYQSGALLRY